MALKDYNKAFRYGKKEYESRLLAGRKPTLDLWKKYYQMRHYQQNHWDLFRFQSIR